MDVDVDHRVPFLKWRLIKGIEVANARVGNDDVNAVPSIDHGVPTLRHTFKRGHVTGVGVDFTFMAFRLQCQFLKFVRASCGGPNLVSGFRQGERTRLSDAT